MKLCAIILELHLKQNYKQYQKYLNLLWKLQKDELYRKRQFNFWAKAVSSSGYVNKVFFPQEP